MNSPTMLPAEFHPLIRKWFEAAIGQPTDIQNKAWPKIAAGEDVLITALRGIAAYGLSWFDAHLWAYAEVNGLPEILSEDFEHGRHYGSVRVVDPFLAAAGDIHELPPMYDTAGL